MKIAFKKDKDSQVKVTQNIDGNEKDFSYLDMIKSLIDAKKLEEPDIGEDFSEAEAKSIKSMIDYINKTVSQDEDPASDLDISDLI